MEHMSAPSAVRISKKDWIPGRFHRRSRATGWAPKVRKTDTLRMGEAFSGATERRWRVWAGTLGTGGTFQVHRWGGCLDSCEEGL